MYYSVANDWYGIVAFIVMWIVVTASCHIFCRHARPPRVFGVPVFPWVPSGQGTHADAAAKNRCQLGMHGCLALLMMFLCGQKLDTGVCLRCTGSMILNCFLLCTLDRDSYVRFGIWSAFCIIVYLLYSLHSIEYHHGLDEKLPQFQCGPSRLCLPVHFHPLSRLPSRM